MIKRRKKCKIASEEEMNECKVERKNAKKEKKANNHCRNNNEEGKMKIGRKKRFKKEGRYANRK
jgi:hypothetical protein